MLLPLDRCVSVEEVMPSCALVGLAKDLHGTLERITDGHFEELTLGAIQEAAHVLQFSEKLGPRVELDALGQELGAHFVALFAGQEVIEELRVAGGVGRLQAAHLSECFEVHVVSDG